MTYNSFAALNIFKILFYFFSAKNKDKAEFINKDKIGRDNCRIFYFS